MFDAPFASTRQEPKPISVPPEARVEAAEASVEKSVSEKGGG